jgi:hypothetical protein
MYTVWVGGIEVLDTYVETLDEAMKIADLWKTEKQYNDVQIEELIY